MKRLSLITVLLCYAVMGFGGFTEYAADVRWTDEVQAYIGCANPWREVVKVEITGYRADGEAIGTATYEMARYSRFYISSRDAFGAGVAWVKLESERKVGAYVHYVHVDGMRASMAQFSESAGPEVWVPNLHDVQEGFTGSVAMVNVSDQSGEAYSQPYFIEDDANGNGSFVRAANAVTVPDFGGPGGQVVFDYEQLYGNNASRLEWDKVSASENISLAAVQHFGTPAGGDGIQMAAVALERTPRQELVMSHLNRDAANFWTQMVLINPFPGRIGFRITSYRENGDEYQRVYGRLEGYERRVFRIDDTSISGLTNDATWLRVQAEDGGLIGYEIFGSPDNRLLSGLEPATVPSSMVILPHTPSSDTLWTGVGIINLSERVVNVQVTGFNDAGEPLANIDGVYMDARAKKLFTTDQLFGDKAAEVTWTRVDTHLNSVSAFCLSGDRARTHLAGFQGVTSQANEGTVFTASFEQRELEFLTDQGWRQNRFFNEGIFFRSRGFYIDGFLEAPAGVRFLAYDPNFASALLNNKEFYDSVAMLSPVFEAPEDLSDLYLTFQLRLIDPEKADDTSRFGLVWREEGSQTWHWFGITGNKLLSDSPQVVREMTRGFYQGEVRNMTNWMPFQAKLPAETRGKRIQVGFYYHKFLQNISEDLPFVIGFFEGPIMLMDQITLQADPLPYNISLFPDGQGSFEHP